MAVVSSHQITSARWIVGNFGGYLHLDVTRVLSGNEVCSWSERIKLNEEGLNQTKDPNDSVKI